MCHSTLSLSKEKAMQFLKPFQEETSKLAKTFLNHNPELMKRYVGTSIHAISYVLVPLNAFMKHLILVQNLDPNVDVAEKRRQRDLQEMNSLFDKVHEKEYEDDYDMSWALKRFEETRSRLKELQLTKEKFMDITNLTRVDCGAAMAPVTQIQADQSDIEMDGAFMTQGDEFSRLVEGPVADDANEFVKTLVEEHKKETAEKEQAARNAKRERVLKDLKDKLFKETVNSPVDAFAALRKALEDVSKSVAATEEKKEEKKSGVKTEKKKLNKAPKIVTQKEKSRVTKAKAERAQELVNRMVKAGLCSSEPEAIARQIAEVLNFNDGNFESLKRVIDRHIAVAPLKNPFKE
jgi:hypothetical protein